MASYPVYALTVPFTASSASPWVHETPNLFHMHGSYFPQMSKLDISVTPVNERQRSSSHSKHSMTICPLCNYRHISINIRMKRQIGNKNMRGWNLHVIYSLKIQTRIIISITIWSCGQLSASFFFLCNILIRDLSVFSPSLPSLFHVIDSKEPDPQGIITRSRSEHLPFYPTKQAISRYLPLSPNKVTRYQPILSQLDDNWNMSKAAFLSPKLTEHFQSPYILTHSLDLSVAHQY